MALTPPELLHTQVSEEEMSRLLLFDLSNEYTHMHHYLMQAATVTGLHRAHLQGLFEEEAKSEMGHVRAFSDKVVAAGLTLLLCSVKPEFVKPCVSAREAVEEAVRLEAEVCENYALRIDQAEHVYETTKKPFWKSMALFYEEQLEHSHHDLDNFRQIAVDLGAAG